MKSSFWARQQAQKSHRSRTHRGRAKAFETAVCPSTSMEARGVIPEGREAWSDHCLHAQRVHTDRWRYTFIVAPRHRDSSKNITTVRVACRHDSHHGLCEHATSSSARDDRVSDWSRNCRRRTPLPDEARLPRAIRTAAFPPRGRGQLRRARRDDRNISVPACCCKAQRPRETRR